MAKRSRKRAARSAKEKAGCMWGLINLFDFRQGHTNQKLLSDRKHGSGRYVGTKCSKSKLDSLSNFADTQEVDEVDCSREEEVNVGMASVKALMDEEMSRLHPSRKIPSDEVERIQSGSGLEVHLEKNPKQTTDQFEKAKDLINDLRTPACLESHKSNCTVPTDVSPLNSDLAAFMIKLYSEPDLKTADHRNHNHFDELDSRLSDEQLLLQKALTNVAEVFLSRNLNDTKHLKETIQSKEFMDALGILNSNKELLLNLLEDPNSILLRCIQDHQNAQVGKLSRLESGSEEVGSSRQCEEPIKQSGYNIFRKKDKSKGAKPSKGSESSDSSHTVNRIVILKPSPARVDDSSITFSPSSSPQSLHSLKCQEDSERVVSHFSLKEIKRRLRFVIGESKKERQMISMDGVLHRIPYGSKDSGDSVKQNSKKGDKKSKPNVCQQNIEYENSSLKVGYHPLNEESFYEEAKKHIIEMLDTGDDDDVLPARQVSKSLARLLSLQEYKGSDLSPIRQCKQEDATDHSGPLIHNLVKTPCNDGNPDNEAKVVDEIPTLIDTQIEEGIGVEEELIQKDPNISCRSMEIVKIADIESGEECSQLNVHSEFDGNESSVTRERFEEEESSTQSGLDSSGEESTATPCVNPPTSLLVQNGKDHESILEKPERPSPVSVLEPFFAEDVNSPGSAADMHAEFPIRPRSIHFEEHDSPEVALTSSVSEADHRTDASDKPGMLGYGRATFEVSGLSCDEISNRWLSSDRSLFDEIGSSFSELSDDPKLLFDYIDEVLLEITPSVSFFKPNAKPILTGGDLVQEVRKGIDWHLKRQSACTMDQIVGKDIEGRTWMDLRSDMESIVVEIGDDILQVLADEAALELWF